MIRSIAATSSRPEGALSRFRKSLIHALREDQGSEAVEFALAFSVWIGVAFMIMYVSFALYAAHFVANSAEEAARYASVRGSSWSAASCSSNALDCTASSTDISNYVKSSLPPGLSSSSLRFHRRGLAQRLQAPAVILRMATIALIAL